MHADRPGLVDAELVSLPGGDLRGRRQDIHIRSPGCRHRSLPQRALVRWPPLPPGSASLTRVVFVVASSAVAFPLGFAEVLPGGMVFGGVLLVTLLYFAVVDFLYVGRLAATCS